MEVTDVVMMIIVGEVTTVKYYGERGVRGRLPLVRCRVKCQRDVTTSQGEVSEGPYH